MLWIKASSVIEDAFLLKKTILDLYSKYKEGSLKIDSKNVEQFHRKELTKKVSEIINSIAIPVKTETS